MLTSLGTAVLATRRSAAGSSRIRPRTRLERSRAIVDNEVVLSGVIERVRVAAGWSGGIASVARAATRPAPVVVGLLRDATVAAYTQSAIRPRTPAFNAGPTPTGDCAGRGYSRMQCGKPPVRPLTRL